MRKMIIDIHTILNLMKDFTAGYSTKSSNQMMIDHKSGRYMVTFQRICDVEDEDMFKTMDRYWR